MMRLKLLFVLTLCLFETINAQQNYKELLLDSIYNSSGFEGTLLIFDAKKKTKYCYNSSNLNARYSPASTFKIFNSLIAFELGIVKDSSTVIFWDKKIRQPEYWNQNLSMKRAFRFSAVWAYQDLARQAGYSNISQWLSACNYGNQNCQGEIDQFWLNDSLKISVEEQLDFLIKLKEDRLPFSKEATQKTREIMFDETTSIGNIYGKTGWAGNSTRDLGWYVGWVEKDDQLFYFVHQLISAELDNKNFAASRKSIPLHVLKTLVN
jgi:beta-lactamase class D